MKLILWNVAKFFLLIIGVMFVITMLGYFVPTLASSGLFAGIPLAILLIALYFLPAYFAHKRKQRNAQAITILNLLLGWTMIGWIAALVWAFTNPGAENVKARSVSVGR